MKPAPARLLAAPLALFLWLPACSSPTTGSAGADGGSPLTGSGSSSGGASDNPSCQDGPTLCVIYKNYPASVAADCASGGGTVVASCPTTDLLGCCSISSSGYTAEECYYAAPEDGGGATAIQYEQSCAAAPGTWSAGL